MDDADALFKALADPTRRAVLDTLAERGVNVIVQKVARETGGTRLSAGFPRSAGTGISCEASPENSVTPSGFLPTPGTRETQRHARNTGTVVHIPHQPKKTGQRPHPGIAST